MFLQVILFDGSRKCISAHAVFCQKNEGLCMSSFLIVGLCMIDGPCISLMNPIPAQQTQCIILCIDVGWAITLSFSPDAGSADDWALPAHPG